MSAACEMSCNDVRGAIRHFDLKVTHAGFIEDSDAIVGK